MWLVVETKVNKYSYVRMYKNLFGTIVSPNYPDNYGNNERKIHIIYGPTNGEIVLIFLDFDVEYQRDCNYDWLKAS